ncbi:MAG: KaiB domain protein [Verrucomicrobiales bacterium]|nr:KaiB domain protein [Verrucomicrobiales bacterium]MDB6130584.1 KaiB domain protein [Verrucomicrobiales bacterium]
MKSHNLTSPDIGQPQVFRLYVTGSTPQSSRAINNIKTICETYLKDRHTLIVIDLYSDKFGAEADQIVVTPTLVRHSPLPKRRMIGDLSDTARVLSTLGIGHSQTVSSHET